jgi:hypothetical protein
MCARSLQNRALRSNVERDPTARPAARQRRSIIEQGDDLMIPTMPFGRTGHHSTRVIFGAAAFSDVPQEVADRTME